MMYIPSWLRGLVMFVVVWGVLYSLPNFLVGESWEDFWSGMPSFLPHKRVELGLDLRGGAHLVLEVKTEEVVKSRIENGVEDVRSALRKARLGYRNLGVYEGRGGRFRWVERDEAGARAALSDLLREGLTWEEEGDEVRLLWSEEVLKDMRERALAQTMEVVRRRIDALGTREPLIQRQGEGRILVQLPGVDNPEYVKVLLGKTAKLTFHLVAEGGTGVGIRQIPGREGGIYGVERRVEVSGEHLSDASPVFEEGRPVVSFVFDGVGGRAFGRTTSKNVGRRLAVVLDGEVISAPVIREPITGGRGVISGTFSSQEAFDLALLLRAGALPAPLDVVEERTVGPSLGADSVRLGTWASGVGLLVVGVLMVLSYGIHGVFAVIALVVNLLLVVSLLSVIGATLTLPGVVGIILTVGMAVDANVLIMERIVEEVKKGMPLYQAMEWGFSRAFGTIVDANVTTLIAGMMLFAFAGGSVKGFAVTLCVGLLTSMFSSMMVTRLLMLIWLKRDPRRVLEV
jgi:preprotein translocase subunit SecD